MILSSNSNPSAGRHQCAARPEQDAAAARYKRRYWKHRVAFSIIDAVQWLAHGQSRGACPAHPPARLLLANGGHLGDAILSTGLLPVIKHAFPQCRIGMLVHPTARPVVEKHPLVEWQHYYEHWFLNRSAISFGAKIRRDRAQRRRLLGELRAIDYDVAIDARMWFPNFFSLLRAAGIPCRIGYDRVAGKHLLTCPVHFVPSRRHELEYQADLLAALKPPAECYAKLRPNLPQPEEAASRRVDALLGDRRAFRVVHMLASAPAKDWPIERWRTLSRALTHAGCKLVFTGIGDRAQAWIRDVSQDLPSCIDACDRLTWAELVQLIARAELVYCVDTSVGHVASAVGTPVVAVSGGMTDPLHWRPWGRSGVVATHRLPCAPCFQRRGCATRGCLRDLSSNAVLEAGAAALAMAVEPHPNGN